MAKVLISFLGTGPTNDKGEGKREYESAVYKIDDKIYETTFVTAALNDHIQANKRIVIGTVKSMWEEYYRYTNHENEEFDEDLWISLSDFSKDSDHRVTDFSIFEKLEVKLDHTHILILKYGLSEEELRYNLSKLFEIENLLENGDELYVDITHGFRSFPIFAQQIIFYLKEISEKNIQVKSFYYGMLEAKQELNYAPVVDMKIILEMNDWLICASQFKNSGDGSGIAKLLENKNKNLSNKVDNFSKALRVNFSHEVKKQLMQLKKLDLSEIDNPEKMILNRVFGDFTNRFNDTLRACDFQVMLAEWYYTQKMYSSAYLILTEALISFVVEKEFGSNEIYEKKKREEVKDNGKIRFKYKEELKLYDTVNKVRKNIAHMLDKRHDTYLNDINNLRNYINKAKSFILQSDQ